MATDFSVSINPPSVISVSTQNSQTYPHRSSHSPSGSDSLSQWYATKEELEYVSGNLGSQDVSLTGNQNILG